MIGAIEIMHNALFKDIPKDKKPKKGGAAGGADEGGEGGGDEGGDEGAPDAPLGSPAPSSEGDKENRTGKRGSPRLSAAAAVAAAGGKAKKPRRAAAAESDDEGAADFLDDGEDEDEQQQPPAPGAAGSSRAGGSPPPAATEEPAGQDEEPPVPLDQLPAGTVDRLKRALGDLVGWNHGEDAHAIATVFAALVDVCVADNVAEPTMGELVVRPRAARNVSPRRSLRCALVIESRAYLLPVQSACASPPPPTVQQACPDSVPRLTMVAPPFPVRAAGGALAPGDERCGDVLGGHRLRSRLSRRPAFFRAAASRHMHLVQAQARGNPEPTTSRMPPPHRAHASRATTGESGLISGIDGYPNAEL